MSKTKVMRSVIRLDRSPMNPRIWCAELECGHEKWFMGRKPRAKVLACERCTKEQGGGKVIDLMEALKQSLAASRSPSDKGGA